MRQGKWLLGLSLLLAAGLALGGCGGSSGGSDGGGGGGTQAVPITDANQALARDNALGAVTTMGDIGSFGVSLVEMLGNMNAGARAAARSAAVLVPGVCSTGTVNVEINDVTPVDQLSTGDTAAVTFASCVMENGFGPETFNGLVTFSVTEVATAPTDFLSAPFDVTFGFVVTNLTVSDGESTTTISGGFDLNLASEDDIAYTKGLSGTSFTLSEGGITATLTNFSYVDTENEASGDYTADASGRLASSEFSGGFIDFDTPTIFSGTGEGNPDDGVLVVTGAAGSELTLTVLDSTTVEVSLDADGNGTPDTGYPVQVLWDDLDI